MNERIRELAEHCVGSRPYNTFDYEKFAELIVRECIANCDDLNSMKYIANHFGIQVKGLNDDR